MLDSDCDACEQHQAETHDTRISDWRAINGNAGGAAYRGLWAAIDVLESLSCPYPDIQAHLDAATKSIDNAMTELIRAMGD
jgi:hypothetical protein